MDPRVKVAWAVIFVLLVNLIPEGEWWVFLFLWIGVWGLAWCSNVGVTEVLKGAVVALPFALAALVIPFTVPGRPLLEVPVVGWQVTAPGLSRFLTILVRFGLAVQMVVLLTRVTRFPDLIWALRGLKIPPSIVTVIGLMYRYLFVIGDEALRMRRARASRSATTSRGNKPSVLWQTRVVGLMIGSLFLRALGRSERIHAAMLSRGYDGSPRSLRSFQMGRLDWLVLILSGMLLVAFLIWRLT